MKVLVCPSGFKGSMDPHTVATCIEAGILRAMPTANIHKIPLADGGEGFARALVRATNGAIREISVLGPVGQPINSHYGILGGKGPKTAVVEIATAAGLSLIPLGCRNPCLTTTYGVGQLMAAALDEGVERIIIGCGDSGTSDGGAGMLQALGVRLLQSNGEELRQAGGGETLVDLASVNLEGLHPRLRNKKVKIEVACNWKNVLCGPQGVARIYGPQKGATAEQTEILAAALDTYASVVKGVLGTDIGTTPGSGASGGLGTGLLLLGATLRPRYEVITEYWGDCEGLFRDCDLVITAEGGIDYQTPQGKIPAEVALRAKQFRKPVIVLAGTVGDNAEVNYSIGIDAYSSIIQRPLTLEQAVEDAERLLVKSAEGAMRMVMVGRMLAGDTHALEEQGALAIQAENSLEVKPGTIVC